MAVTEKTEELDIAEATWISGFQIEAQVRDLAPFPIDEPEIRGGTNSGPAPIECMMGGFAGCIIVILNLVAKEMSFRFNGVRARATASLDPRAIAGREGVEHFHWIRLEVTLTTAESAERVERVKELVRRRCPVHNLIRKSGTPLEEQWTISV
jgi:uncharacterized OsmC-like protein